MEEGTYDLMTLLAGRREEPLGNGFSLRLLPAWDLLDARREASLLAAETELPCPLCSNACLVARALVWEGTAVFHYGKDVLKNLTEAQIERLATSWAEMNVRENPSPQDGEERLEKLKKAWSTRPTRAFNGACSKASAHCPRRSGHGR